MINLSKEIIGNCESKVKSQIVLPSDPNYDEVRKIWNAMIDPPLTPGSRNYWKSHDFTELSVSALNSDDRVRWQVAFAALQDLDRARRGRSQPRSGRFDGISSSRR